MISEKKKRHYLNSVLINYLLTNISLMEYLKSMASDSKSKRVCTKNINATKKAISQLGKIKHIEVLEYLYGIFMGNNIIAYSISGKLVTSKKLTYYDSEKGFNEFKDMLEEQKQIREEQERKRKESVEALKRAKEMGKKVEMVYDPTTKTTKPLIVEDKEEH